MSNNIKIFPNLFYQVLRILQIYENSPFWQDLFYKCIVIYSVLIHILTKIQQSIHRFIYLWIHNNTINKVYSKLIAASNYSMQLSYATKIHNNSNSLFSSDSFWFYASKTSSISPLLLDSAFDFLCKIVTFLKDVYQFTNFNTYQKGIVIFPQFQNVTYM